MCLRLVCSISAVVLQLFPRILLCLRAHCAITSTLDMCTATWSSGVYLVCFKCLQAKSPKCSILTFFFFFLYFSDHAKLKDHVATMEGQLDAQIQEGGMSFFFFGAFLSFRVKSKNISRAPLTNNRFESQSGTTSAGFTCAGVTYSKQHSCAG